MMGTRCVHTSNTNPISNFLASARAEAGSRARNCYATLRRTRTKGKNTGEIAKKHRGNKPRPDDAAEALSGTRPLTLPIASTIVQSGARSLTVTNTGWTMNGRRRYTRTNCREKRHTRRHTAEWAGKTSTRHGGRQQNEYGSRPVLSRCPVPPRCADRPPSLPRRGRAVPWLPMLAHAIGRTAVSFLSLSLPPLPLSLSLCLSVSLSLSLKITNSSLIRWLTTLHVLRMSARWL